MLISKSTAMVPAVFALILVLQSSFQSVKAAEPEDFLDTYNQFYRRQLANEQRSRPPCTYWYRPPLNTNCKSILASFDLTVDEFIRLNPNGGIKSSVDGKDCGPIMVWDYCVQGLKPVVSDDGKCGPSNGGKSCVGSTFGDCCGATGRCGSGSAFCGIGNCIGGNCVNGTGWSIDGNCGYIQGKCGGKWGNCCNVYNKCGTGKDYCGAGKCISGECDAVSELPDWEAITSSLSIVPPTGTINTSTTSFKGASTSSKSGPITTALTSTSSASQCKSTDYSASACPTPYDGCCAYLCAKAGIPFKICQMTNQTLQASCTPCGSAPTPTPTSSSTKK